MLELPETAVLAKQASASLAGKCIKRVIAGQNPHKFAWFSGDPAEYPARLEHKTMGQAAAYGGMLELLVDDMTLVFGDGVVLRYFPPGGERPPRHQLLLELEDGSALVATIAMYGGLWCVPAGSNDNPYYLAAVQKPSPLTPAFTTDYFDSLFDPDSLKLPLKGFLATQQRIPGLGNGVLQEILFMAKMHPRRKASTLDDSGRQALYSAVTGTLESMVAGGGRDTEGDLFGNPGGYQTLMSKNTVGKPCLVCGSVIQKQAYMGGSIYFCPGCQIVDGG